MKKLLLTSINARFTHLNLASLYLREVLKELPLRTQLAEYSLQKPFIDILYDILQEKPDYIAFSTYIWNKEIVQKLIPEIKKCSPSTIIILGGPEVSYNAQEWQKAYPQVDHIIQGKGEDALYQYFHNPQEKHPYLIKGNNIHLNELPFPYTKEDFPKNDCRYIYYESTRGCPYRCAYCLSSNEEQKLEFRDTNKVLKELDFLCSQNIRIIKFIDRTFNKKPSHYRTIWKHLIQKTEDITFHFEIHPLFLEEEDFKILQEAPQGLFQFEIGIQSIHEETLKAINRKDNWKQSKEKIQRLIDLGTIHTHIGLIAGLPFENLEMFKETFNQSLSLNPDHLQLGFLKVLPGTAMHDKAKEYGIKYLSTPDYQVLETQWLKSEEIIRLRQIAELHDILHQGGKFKETLHYLFQLGKNPFDFYKDLAQHFFQDNRPFPKDWEKIIQILIPYIRKNWPEEKELLQDALRWDWTQIAKSNYYPPQIQRSNQDIGKIKDRIKKYLRDSHSLHHQAISSHEMNRAIVYLPETEKFKTDKKLRKWNLLIKPSNQVLSLDPLSMKGT